MPEMEDELCETGQTLWENYRISCNEDIYKNYVDHIKSCATCIKKLGLSEFDIELLNEKDLEPINDLLID